MIELALLSSWSEIFVIGEYECERLVLVLDVSMIRLDVKVVSAIFGVLGRFAEQFLGKSVTLGAQNGLFESDIFEACHGWLSRD